MARTERKRLPPLSAEVPQFVIDKAEDLVKQVRPLGHPRAVRQDIIGALIDAATAKEAAAALNSYNPKLGRVLEDLDEV